MLLDNSTLDNSIDESMFAPGIEDNPLLSPIAIAADLGSFFVGKSLIKKSEALSKRKSRLTKQVRTIRRATKKLWRSGRIDPKKASLLRKTKADRISELKSVRKSKITKLSRAGKTLTGISKGLLFMGMLDLGYSMGKGIFSIAESYRTSRDSLNQSISAGYEDTAYYDSRRAFTQRQRAIQAIHNSQLSTRFAFGAEASYLHQ